MLPHQDDKIKAKEVEQREVKKGLTYQGSYRIHTGHRIYELEIKTGILQLASIKETITLEKTVKKEMVKREGCVYLPALNIGNAKKKFKRLLPITYRFTIK